jgi:hypothetical protein
MHSAVPVPGRLGTAPDLAESRKPENGSYPPPVRPSRSTLVVLVL